MLNTVYINSFKEMLRVLLEQETNINNILILEQVKDIHFTTAYTHLELIDGLEYCINNCNKKCHPMYLALIIGIRLEVDVLASLN